MGWAVLNASTATVCGVSSIIDSAGGNWRKIGGVSTTAGGNAQDVEVWGASFVNPQTPSYTLTVTPTNSIPGANAYGQITVAIYSNVNLVDDITAVVATGTGLTATPGPFTPVGSADILMAVVKADQIQSTTPSIWTQVHTNHGADVEIAIGLTGPQSPSWTYGTLTNWASIAVAEKIIANPTYPVGFVSTPRSRPFGVRASLNRNDRITDTALIAMSINDGGSDQIWNSARLNYPAKITTAAGAIYWRSGPEGFGFYSTGSGDYATFGSTATTTILSPATLPCSWSSRFTIQSPSSTTLGKPFGSWSSGSPYQNWGIFQDFSVNTGYVGIAMGNTTGPTDLLLAYLNPGSVHTVTGTWDGHTMKGYIDGLFIAALVPIQTSGMITGEVRIGTNSTAQEPWTSPIYSAFLWPRCLSAPEVFQHAQYS